MVQVALIMPVPLSYFSPIVGGLPGASALGMEPTYYWDALDNEALTRLEARHHRSWSEGCVSTFPTSWLYLREVGKLPAGLLPSDRGVWTW